ncbi:hypothetical protein Pla52o_10400 [Novipirellula galeiformis]|uniref:Glycosyltransferase 61 catalytic domain-containing protein n=1 Tax=Novipirellula galeiformis TaxID=2528004 RepID=A0A5C6CW15_9BACT|nr:glycosyltransferase family 61 protein [Novipirellula galeiformis]TWU27176.1 hypothetical protein Pla52o_10400 [Novipirellula galeiformis]
MNPSLLDRVRNRLIRNLNVPPRYLGYPCLQQTASEDYCTEQGTTWCRLMDDEPGDFRLPQNIHSRTELEDSRGKYAFSFYDVPELLQLGPVAAELRDCRLLRVRSPWQNDFYAVITNDDREVVVDGCQFSPDHARLLRGRPTVRQIDSACWVGTHSTRNYFLWLFFHLPRIHLAQTHLPDVPILLPAADLLDQPRRDALQMLGVRDPLFLESADEVIEVRRLNVFRYSMFNSRVLGEIRQRLTSGLPPGRKDRRIYICREECANRRMSNETEFWNKIQPYGFERVFLEKLSFVEQMEVMASAQAVIGLHGAGFANLLFCAPGTRVAEIRDSGSPNPHFYAVASILGHDYWHFVGKPAEGKPLFRDLHVDLDALQPFLNAVSGEHPL